MPLPPVIASPRHGGGVAIQFRIPTVCPETTPDLTADLDCFVALAPRNDALSLRSDRRRRAVTTFA